MILKKEIFRGTIDNVEAHPREVFKEAIKESATFMIIMHNHPSGDTSPSEEDKEITKRIVEKFGFSEMEAFKKLIFSSF